MPRNAASTNDLQALPPLVPEFRQLHIAQGM